MHSLPNADLQESLPAKSLSDFVRSRLKYEPRSHPEPCTGEHKVVTEGEVASLYQLHHSESKQPR